MQLKDEAYIRSLIPHRPPMLLIDEVSELSENDIVCHKTFRDEEFFFQGHYPDQPIVPGMILCECAAQAGAVLIAAGGVSIQGIPVLTRLNDVRFRQIVRPRDTIAIHVTREEQLAQATYFSSTIRLGDKLVASLRFAAMMSGGT